MMVSDFIELIGRLVNMSTTTLITITILSIIMGAITQKVATGIQSSVVLTVAGLVALLIWSHLWKTDETLWGVLFTVSIAVVGYELYRRLVGPYG